MKINAKFFEVPLYFLAGCKLNICQKKNREWEFFKNVFYFRNSFPISPQGTMNER